MIIFLYRRGYTTERQKGLLIVEKLDYLQSKLLQNIFLFVARPLARLGVWLDKVVDIRYFLFSLIPVYKSL